MATILWKDGKEYRVEAHAVQRHLAAGYTVTNEPEKKAEALAVEAVDLNAQIDDNGAQSDNVDLEAARQMYEEKFGERPHGRMKLESIMEKLEDADKPV